MPVSLEKWIIYTGIVTLLFTFIKLVSLYLHHKVFDLQEAVKIEDDSSDPLDTNMLRCDNPVARFVNNY